MEMAGGWSMRSLKCGIILALAACVASCGGNSTPIGVTVAAVGVSNTGPVTVLLNGHQSFVANITGGSNTATWAVCLPPVITGGQPVNCNSGNLGTITLTNSNGTSAVYTAPATIPTPNSFIVAAFSTVDPTIFGDYTVTVDSGIRIRLKPLTATIAENQSLLLTATVTGPTSTALTWTVNNIAGGDLPTVGTITPGANNTATYLAPPVIPTAGITVEATSAVDPSQSGSASISVVVPADPVLSSIDPTTALEGSAQQDVYLNGSNFLTNDTVYAQSNPPGGPWVVVPTTFITTSLLRATVPSNFFTTLAPVSLRVQRSTTDVSQLQSLSIEPVRPVVIASSPDSMSPNGASVNVTLTGGFFSTGGAPSAASQNTVAYFNCFGAGCTNYAQVNTSRQLTVTAPVNSLTVPGLYPILVQNNDAAGAALPIPSVSAINVAVEPLPTSIPGAATATLGVGASPSAVAIDHETGLAYVLNQGDSSVTVINLKAAPPVVVSTIANVGANPTGIAIDDLLSPDHFAVVVSGNNTLSTIDLTSGVVTNYAALLPTGFTPVSVGVNPLTHRAIVANELTNLATIIDLSTLPANAPLLVQQIGGTNTNFSTGISPSVDVDPRLNWAIVTPGGGGTIDIVDLGRNPSPTNPILGDEGRIPQMVATFDLSTAVKGVGIDPETHSVLFTNPTGTTLTAFSLLDNSILPVTFTQGGTGYVAAATNPLANIGVAVNTGGTAAIVDLATGNTLASNISLGTSPQAVAIDPASNQAVVVNQGSNNVSILSLGAMRNLHIVETSPAVTYTSASNLQITINGSGFTASSQVLLDGVAVGSSFQNSRQILATVPASMLGSARRYSVNVQNPGAPAPNVISNATDLTVIQPVAVGLSPVGVAVDTDRDLAVVSNFGDGTVSLVDLTNGTNLPSSPISAGANPQSVSVLPRLGLALIADTGSNQVTVVNEVAGTGTTAAICSNCDGPTATAIDEDSAIGYYTNATTNNAGTITLSSTGFPQSILQSLDQNPTSAAVDPDLDILAFGTSSQQSSVQLLNEQTNQSVRIPNQALPTGIVFDPVNQVFLVANRQANNVTIIDPSTFIQTPVPAGIDPTSLDYNFQTSSIVTANNATNAMSVLDYVCPPTGALPNCTAPQVRAIIPFGGSQQFSVAVDARLNLAVVADQNNNRILLVPLPH